MQQRVVEMQRVRTEPDPFEPFALAQAIAMGDWLFVSGQAALDKQGTVVGQGDFRQQAECAFSSREQVLRPEVQAWRMSSRSHCFLSTCATSLR